MARDAQGIVVATGSSEKNGIVGIGCAIHDTTTGTFDIAPIATYTATLGPRDRLNPYFAELIAISTALWNLAALPIRNRIINILSSNLLALQAINHPKQQLGQTYINQIYKLAGKLMDMDNQILAI